MARAAKSELDFQDSMRERIRSRLDNLKITVTKASTDAGLQRGYLSDFLVGKKASIGSEVLSPLSRVLHCDVMYILGDQPMPRASKSGKPGPVPHLTVVGNIEIGAWRETVASEDGPPCNLVPDPRWLPEQQFALEVIGDSANSIARAGSIIHIIAVPPTLGDGQLVLVRKRHSAGGLIEQSLRIVRGENLTELWAPSTKAVSAIHIDRSVEIVGFPLAVYDELA